MSLRAFVSLSLLLLANSGFQVVAHPSLKLRGGEAGMTGGLVFGGYGRGLPRRLDASSQ